MRDVVEEGNGEFVLPLAGFVSRGFQERVDGVELFLRSEDWRGDARLVVNDEARRPEIVSLAVERSRVDRAVVSRESTLKVQFADGALLEVPAGEFEEWEVQGPGEIVVVSPAGGGEAAVWDATSKTYRLQGGELVELEEGESR